MIRSTDHAMTDEARTDARFLVRSRGRLLLAAGILTAALLPSCNSPAKESSSKPVAATAAASSLSPPATLPTLGAHWIQDGRLRGLMTTLSKRAPSWPAGVPQEPESPNTAPASQFDEMAAAAKQLSETAELFPTIATGIKMTEADRSGFLAEGKSLRDQALRLQAAAKDRKIEQMQREMDTINSTCISCHSRYRDISGPLNSPRADLGGFRDLERAVVSDDVAR